MRVKPEPTAAWIKIARLAGDVPTDAPLSPAAAVGTPDQQSAFARGATLQRDGDFGAAAPIFEALASSAAADVAAAARLRLGEALIGARSPADALGPLQLAEAAQPPGSAASFLLGRALADAGRCQDALAYFEQFATANPGPLAAQAQVAEANCLASPDRPSEAVGFVSQAVATTDVSRLQTLDFREKLALARVRAGDVAGARAEYESLLALARSSSYRAELSYYLGLLAPDSSSAASRFRSSVQLDPRGRAARAALDELVALAGQSDPFATSFEAGDTRFEQNRYREALAAYTAFIQQNPADPRVPKALRAGRGAGTTWPGARRHRRPGEHRRAFSKHARRRRRPVPRGVASVRAWPTWTARRAPTGASWPSLGRELPDVPTTPSSDWPSCSSNRATSAWPATAGGTSRVARHPRSQGPGVLLAGQGATCLWRRGRRSGGLDVGARCRPAWLLRPARRRPARRPDRPAGAGRPDVAHRPGACRRGPDGRAF